MGMGAGGSVRIEVINNAGVNVSVIEDAENQRARIIIDQAVAESKAEILSEISEDVLAGSIKTGQGIFNATLEETFDLNRKL